MMTYIYIAILIIGVIYAKGILLNFASKFLDIIIYPLNILSIIYENATKPKFWEKFNQEMFNDALETDIFLHNNYAPFWNVTSSKGGTKFGRKDMTLSAMIGLKKEEKTLVFLLWFFYYFLYLIDHKEWKNGGHCKSAFLYYKLRQPLK